MKDRKSWAVANLLPAVLVVVLFVVAWRAADPPKPVSQGPVAAAEPPTTEKRPGIPYHELNWKYDLLGKTGKPLGEIITVQGQVDDSFRKGPESGLYLRVQRVNGEAVLDEKRLTLAPSPSDAEKGFESLKAGKSYEMRGYEEGSYSGIPDEAWKDLKYAIQTTRFHFRVGFVVLKAKEIPEIHFGPADFLDRFALLEGTARTETGKGYLVRGNWKLLALEFGGWPQHMEGKVVEADGIPRRLSKGQNVFRLDNGNARLVQLIDQVGREVELTGQAWSRNGLWHFDYRGTDIHVENMDKLPEWKADRHGEKLIISGVLEEALLPRIDQIGLKTDSDLVRQFIVRKASWRLLQRLEIIK